MVYISYYRRRCRSMRELYDTHQIWTPICRCRCLSMTALISEKLR